ncbi:MAG: hypothetical protein ACUVQ1_05550 [Candidatus Kapaibacteriales bacterium]
MEKSEKTQKISGVTNLIHNFRGALLALLPNLEKSGITWQKLDELDVFDNICESLFELIVLPKIETFMLNKHHFVPSLPKYGLFYKDYSKSSYIEALPFRNEPSGTIYTFVLFKSKSAPFDTVLCNLIDQKGSIIQRDIELNFDELTFRFRYKADNIDICLS